MIMSDLYTTKTAALKAIKADVSKLNTKSLKVNGKDVATSVKHPNDTREVITENDLWGSWAEIKDGEIIFHEDEVISPGFSVDDPNTGCLEAEAWDVDITKVENNKAYKGDILFANVETNKIKNGEKMFSFCSKLANFSSDLSLLTNGYSMFYNCSNLIAFTSDLSSLTKGNNMFDGCSKLTTFTSDSSGSPVNLSSLTNGGTMFQGCTNLTTFTYDLSSLTNGSWMFHGCSNLSTFTSDLSSLINGEYMFWGCSKLSSFTKNLSSLTSGEYMFRDCSKLSTFASDLSSLTDGSDMFYNCIALTAFTSDLSSLTYGYGMFYNCIALTAFASDLSSLTNGYQMFYNCKLDTDSLIHIAETIKDVRDLTNGKSYWADIYKTIYIGIGNTTPTEEETELLTEIHNKGWQVYVNGSSDSNIFNPTNTTSLDGEESVTPIPFYAKPVESDEEHAEYTDGNDKFYNILGGQFIFVDDLETYGMFTSLEDAAANMRLTKIEKQEIEKA